MATPEDKLLAYLGLFCKVNGYKIIIPDRDEEEIDFVNLNFRTKEMYVGEMGIDEIID